MKKSPFRVKNFVMLTFSGIVNAVGIVLFLTPSNLFDSGFSGTSMFLSAVTGLPLALFLLVLNLPFLFSVIGSSVRCLRFTRFTRF